MKILHAEATYNKEDKKLFFVKAFHLSGFKMDQAEETIVDSKEVKYTLGDKVIRFVKYDPMNEFGGFYMQYHVLELTEEDKVAAPKKMYSSSKIADKEKLIAQSFNEQKQEVKDKPADSNAITTVEPISIVSNIENKEKPSFYTEEPLELTGRELQDYLEDKGQQTLF